MPDHEARRPGGPPAPAPPPSYESPPPAAAPPPTFTVDRPTAAATTAWEEVLREEAQVLVVWAEANRRDARADRIAFWMFKLPTIVSASTAALLVTLEAPTWVSALLAALAAVSAGVDAMRPRGLLHRAHQTAFHDLRDLQQDVRSEIGAIKLSPEADRTAMANEFLKEIVARRTAISRRIKRAEAALGQDSGSGAEEAPTKTTG